MDVPLRRNSGVRDAAAGAAMGSTLVTQADRSLRPRYHFAAAEVSVDALVGHPLRRLMYGRECYIVGIVPLGRLLPLAWRGKEGKGGAV